VKCKYRKIFLNCGEKEQKQQVTAVTQDARI